MGYLIFIITGYLSGSILYAYLIPKIFLKIDIRGKSTDQNPGVVNAFINGGVFYGIPTGDTAAHQQRLLPRGKNHPPHGDHGPLHRSGSARPPGVYQELESAGQGCLRPRRGEPG